MYVHSYAFRSPEKTSRNTKDPVRFYRTLRLLGRHNALLAENERCIASIIAGFGSIGRHRRMNVPLIRTESRKLHNTSLYFPPFIRRPLALGVQLLPVDDPFHIRLDFDGRFILLSE